MVTNHEENLRTIYEQYWLHARHQENQRLWYTNIYAIIVGGIAGFTSFRPEWFLPALVVGFSWLGFFICHGVRIPFLRYSRYTDVILWNHWNLGREYARFLRKPPGPPPEKRSKKDAMVKAFGFSRFRGRSELRDKATNVSLMFHSFYMLMATAFTAWAANLRWGWDWRMIVAPVAMFVSMWAIYNFLFGPLEERARDEMARKVDWNRVQGSN